tara:strand:+ start:10902 stop:11174 length:273 start_codon:yes stop_codon:yes gene_type:complete
MKTEEEKLSEKLKTLLGAYVLEVEFIKQNGDTRKMSCTTKSDKIPETHQPKTENVTTLNEGVLRVFDVEVEGWRSFRVDSVKSFGLKEKV